MAEITQLPTSLSGGDAGATSPWGQTRGERLARLGDEVDPSASYGTRRIWAALRSLGLQPEDLEPVVAADIAISPDVPEGNVAKIRNQRASTWEGLRQSRLAELSRKLEDIRDDDVPRLAKTSGHLRAVRPDDIPDVDGLHGMSDFNDMQRRRTAQMQAEQQEKANNLVTQFLKDKRRMEEADKKTAALEQRLKEFHKERDDAIKAKRLENFKKAEKRQQGVDRAAKEREEKANEMEAKANERLQNARKTRAQYYSKESLVARNEESNRKRDEALMNAIEMEADLVAVLEDKRLALDDRLEEDRQRRLEEQQQKAEFMREKFHNRQIKVYRLTQEWAEKKKDEHLKFTKKCNQFQSAGQEALKARSKSTGDLTKKAMDKWRSGNERNKAARQEWCNKLMEKQQQDDERRDATTHLKLKCGNDVFSAKEVKEGTFKELQTRRLREVQGSRVANSQALVFKIAEDVAKNKVQFEGHEELKRRRQDLAKDALTFADRAAEVFIRVKSEPDEGKIERMLTKVGFEMPKLPGDEADGGAEEGKPAY